MIIAQKGWLTKLIQPLLKNEWIGITSPKLVYPNETVQYAGATFKFIQKKGMPRPQLVCYHIGRNQEPKKYTKQREIPMATFACIVTRRELIMGGLDEEYKMGTFEDVDLCCRMREYGYKILFMPEVTIYHYEGHTTHRIPDFLWKPQQHINYRRWLSRWGEWINLNMQAHPKVYQE
jgi:GT2 family glycosyltransferase